MHENENVYEAVGDGDLVGGRAASCI